MYLVIVMLNFWIVSTKTNMNGPTSAENQAARKSAASPTPAVYSVTSEKSTANTAAPNPATSALTPTANGAAARASRGRKTFPNISAESIGTSARSQIPSSTSLVPQSPLPLNYLSRRWPPVFGMARKPENEDETVRTTAITAKEQTRTNLKVRGTYICKSKS